MMLFIKYINLYTLFVKTVTIYLYMLPMYKLPKVTIYMYVTHVYTILNVIIHLNARSKFVCFLF